MIRGTFTALTLFSVVLFPWPFAALLALIGALPIPLLPLATGLLVDVLYYVPAPHTLPLATVVGALVSGGAYHVRSRLKMGIIT